MTRIVKRVDAAERRHDRRVRAPILVAEIAGQSYRSLDWSLGGMTIRGYAGPGRPGSRLFGCLYVPGMPQPFAFDAEILRINRERQSAAMRFISLPREAVVALDRALA